MNGALIPMNSQLRKTCTELLLNWQTPGLSKVSGSTDRFTLGAQIISHPGTFSPFAISLGSFKFSKECMCRCNIQTCTDLLQVLWKVRLH